jgi:hypothetical protein
MKRKAFTVRLEIFPFDIRFSFGESDKRVIRWLKKHKFEKKDFEDVHMEDYCHGRTIMFENGAQLIRMNVVPKRPIDFAHLHHEITHAVMFLLWVKIKTPHTMKTTETYAYLTDYITEKVYDQILKK